MSVHAIIKSLDLTGFNVLNIGSSVETKIITVAKLISKELRVKKKNCAFDIHYQKHNYHSKADIKKTKKVLKWSPRIKLKSGLKKVIKYELFKKTS